ncbi:MAG TPA: phosphoribosyltransferase family protein, partial [Thermosynergistes sp.]|nr:phosphoribosyltransferase family protein [Thermosynergistes sp.]
APVPLHRRSERPYNQARALACGVSDVWGIPTEEGLKWIADVEPQTRLGASSRRTLPKGALEWRGLPLNGKAVIIVDDVCTTGSTLSCAARAVEKAGGFPAAAIVWSVSL